jgi:glycosyltransferase involved in cell wall biosynthesis
VKADLHLHSRYSSRPPEWFFRRVGLPDSCSEPRALYKQLCDRGMDLVTITDHNRIEGCLEIADLPGVFISEQVSARFPEDRCQAHILVWGITELQHREIHSLRENIFDLQRYLASSQIVHAVAHPFYRLDERLSRAHIEKLVLLFRHFEGLNGHRDALLSETARFALSALTPAKIDELANRHAIAPTHAEPWKKIFTAGSDDHGGIYPASAYTETAGATLPEFLAALREGRCSIHGTGGAPLAVSHSLYNNLRVFIGEKFAGAKSSTLLGKAFSRFMEGENPTEFSWTDKLIFVAEGIASGKIFELAKPANASLWKQFSATFTGSEIKELLARETAGITEPERRAFVIANFFINQLAFRFFTTFVQQLSNGNIIEAIQEISVLLPVLAPLAPYVYAFRSQAPDRPWLAAICDELAGSRPASLRNRKRAWFTDTLEDVNGVANTIRKLTATCVANGHDLTVVTSRSSIHITDIPIKNFAPIGEFELPEYELQKLSFPPILQMIDFIQREGFTELIISTPGPIGITALLAGKILGLRTSGIYHTDFPQYVRILTDDNFLETLTWNYMKWFYEQLDLLYVNSEGYRRAWIDRGIAAQKICILPRGLDTLLFHPSRRDPAFWTKYGIPAGATVLLYVGRVSKEKDLDLIVAAAGRIADRGLRIGSPESHQPPLVPYAAASADCGFAQATNEHASTAEAAPSDRRHSPFGLRHSSALPAESLAIAHSSEPPSPGPIGGTNGADHWPEAGVHSPTPAPHEFNPQSAIPNPQSGRVVFAFVGDGPYLKELRSLLPEATFTGYLAGLELARAFASSDVFLFPSTTDTFGNVILEALASGVPCVVSDQGGPKDLIAHAKTGFITRALDADDFTHHVEKIAFDPALRQAMGIEAHHTVQGRDWAEAGRKFWELSAD